MGFLDKIGGKINEKIDETLNPKDSAHRGNLDWKEKHSSDMLKTHGKEIMELEERMGEYYDNESYQDLLGCCLDIRKIDSFHFPARKLTVYALRKLELYQKAYDACIDMLNEYPNNDFLLFEKGLILYDSSEYVDSISIFEKLIQKTPYTDVLAIEYKLRKASALLNSHNFEEAIQFCDEELKLHENEEDLIEIKNKALEEIEEREKRVNEEKEQKEILEQKKQESLQNNSGSSIADELSKFNKLKEQGAITEEEFSEMKKKLMDKM